jgi:hypothetical protein
MITRRVLGMTSGLLLLGATMAGAQTSKGGAASAGDMNRHSMEGEVTKVDAKRGWIDVKTSEGSMKLHYPPEALASVKKGDSVTVELGIKDHGPSTSGSGKTTR